ncbi:TPA: hypothetical protein KOS16_003492 [Clostridioides difficile]|nr:hypothetical protein [Clostridioides difficile]
MVKQVSKILGEIETGTTVPLIGIIDDEQVIIKTFRNRCGHKILINEFVCLELAKILELPIPDGGICIINNDTDIEQLLEYEKCLDDVEGIGFYSKKINKVSEVTDIEYKHANKIYNKKDIIKVIIFDHFIHNKDRHDGNMLTGMTKSNKGSSFSIIDHSHVFNMDVTNPEAWIKINEQKYNEKEILRENEIIYKNFYGVVDINLEVLTDEARIFKDRLDENVISNILNKIPKEWMNNIKKEDILKYLLHRLNSIDEICKFIIENINCTGGECSESSFFSFNI